MHFLSKLWRSRPTAKTTVITLVVCLAFGLALTGFHPGALWGLVLAALVLMYITVRNWDPDSFEAWNDPLAHSLRHQRDDLYVALRELADAVENDTNDLSDKAEAARRLLDTFKPRARAKR